eukprot:TRINITY_DN70745_c0_g1_i1.p1 TRINITY_DN70745_c0_g1~~TRINITY_DN70745_c0_g1_i1.p1  ORF type:complete len:574 (+),score=180.90 TRINITY_DN70745_c0_g1_i1:88-1809(+)
MAAADEERAPLLDGQPQKKQGCCSGGPLAWMLEPSAAPPGPPRPESELQVPETALYMVLVTRFIDTLANSISITILPFYAKEFGVGNDAIGYLYGSWSLMSTLGAPVLAWLTDAIGRRKVLLLSLLGAGTSALAQGAATSYYALLVARGLSGCFAAIGSTCNVYVTDVTPDERTRPGMRKQWLTHLSTVMPLAIVFGPSTGGGLSELGLNVPIITDGCLTFAAFFCVYTYLWESPVWLEHHKKSKESGDDGGGCTKFVKSLHWEVWVLSLSGFFNGIGFSIALSMYAVYASQRLGLNALRVGFIYMARAVIMFVTNFWITPKCQSSFTSRNLQIISCVLVGITALGITYAPDVGPEFGYADAAVWISIAFTLIQNLFQTMAGSSRTTLLMTYTDASNRARVNSVVSMITNAGRIVGPVWGGWAAASDVRMPFAICCVANLLSGLSLLLMRDDEAEEPPVCTSEGGVRLDCGTPDDFRNLGEYCGKLLSRRGYRWTEPKVDGKAPNADFQSLFEQFFPELDLSSAERHKLSLAHVHGRALMQGKYDECLDTCFMQECRDNTGVGFCEQSKCKDQ